MTQEADYQLLRWRVLNAPVERLRRAGARLVVGYRDLDELRALVQREWVERVVDKQSPSSEPAPEPVQAANAERFGGGFERPAAAVKELVENAEPVDLSV